MLKNRFLVLPLLGALALGGCDDFGTSAEGDGTARVSLLLTDAPGDFRAAVVTITDIYLQPAAGDSGQRVYLRENSPVTTNLLTLSNDVLELVDDRAIPAGRYGQLRLVISGGYIEVEGANGGSSIYATSPSYAGLPSGAKVAGELKCPSCSQSGFKVILGATASSGEGDGDDGVTLEGEQTLLVDFDVSKSFGKQAGNSGMWILRPTLKATSLQTSSSVSVSLALADSVKLPLLAGTQVTLGRFSATLAPAAGGDAKVVALADSNADGVYEASFKYLLPGEYRVGFTGPAGLSFATDRALPFGVTVASGASSTVAFKLTRAGI